MRGNVSLSVNQVIVNDFCDLISDIVHFSNPLHLIFCFELFSNTFLLRKLFNELVKHFVCFLINICKIRREFAARQQVCVDNRMVIFEVSQMSLAPNSDFNLWLFGQFQIRQQVISLLCVCNLCRHNSDLP